MNLSDRLRHVYAAVDSPVALRRSLIMKKTKQFTFALENKPGGLAEVTACLAKAKLNIVAMSVVDTAEQCLLRVVVDKPAQLQKLLKDCECSVVVSDVLLVELANQPGSLAKAAERLAKKRVNVDFVYGSGGRGKAKTNVVFGVKNFATASKALARL